MHGIEWTACVYQRLSSSSFQSEAYLDTSGATYCLATSLEVCIPGQELLSEEWLHFDSTHDVRANQHNKWHRDENCTVCIRLSSLLCWVRILWQGCPIVSKSRQQIRFFGVDMVGCSSSLRMLSLMLLILSLQGAPCHPQAHYTLRQFLSVYSKTRSSAQPCCHEAVQVR